MFCSCIGLNPLVLAMTGAALVLLGFAWAPGANDTALSELADTTPRFLPTESLTIVTAQGASQFEVEVADTVETRRRGLMFRTELADRSGMLFDLESERPISVWMRHTGLSLDMVFICADGRITNIVKDTKPYSETLIPSEGPVLAVLELPAGSADRLGFAPGDQVLHRLFPPHKGPASPFRRLRHTAAAPPIDPTTPNWPRRTRPSHAHRRSTSPVRSSKTVTYGAGMGSWRQVSGFGRPVPAGQQLPS